MDKHGKFITFEGIDGMGKSVALQFFAKALQVHSIPYITTREPGGTELGEEIRQLLLVPRNEPITPISELLMIFTARSEHVEKLIKPTLMQGTWVLCDRFVDASFAYQGGGRGIKNEQIATLTDWVVGDLYPDCTILLDGPPEIGALRAGGRGNLDRFEQEEMTFFHQVRQTYLELAQLHRDRYRIIDATQTLEEVEADIMKVVESCLIIMN